MGLMHVQNKLYFLYISGYNFKKMQFFWWWKQNLKKEIPPWNSYAIHHISLIFLFLQDSKYTEKISENVFFLCKS